MKNLRQPESACGPERSGWRIGILGTGGQGVLTAARLLCDVFVERGHEVVSSQLHGMAKRGGAVASSIKIDAGPSPMLAPGSADVVLGFEPIEAARGLSLVSSRTSVFMNTAPVLPYVLAQQAASNDGEVDYPNVDELIGSIRAATPHVFPIEATRIAAEAGSTKALNMVMLGCLLGSGLLPCSPGDFWSAVAADAPPAWAEVNRRAFDLGAAMGEGIRTAELELRT